MPGKGEEYNRVSVYLEKRRKKGNGLRTPTVGFGRKKTRRRNKTKEEKREVYRVRFKGKTGGVRSGSRRKGLNSV